MYLCDKSKAEAPRGCRQRSGLFFCPWAGPRDQIKDNLCVSECKYKCERECEIFVCVNSVYSGG